jgi:peroxiredoxin Q/BCP
MILQTGDSAPDIRLGNFQLSKLRGKHVVIFFFAKIDMPGCTKESCEFRDAFRQFADLNAEIVGVSPDSVQEQEWFRTKYGLPFTLLPDTDHAIAEAYGVWVKKSMYGRGYMGIERSTFVVGPNGNIARIFPKVIVAGHVAAILKTGLSASMPAGTLVRRLAWVWGCGLAALLLYVSVSVWNTERTFRAMTPAQHLTAARLALEQRRFDDGIEQLTGIKADAPENAAAKVLETDLRTAKQAAQQEQAAAALEKAAAEQEQAAAALSAEKARVASVQSLQTSLTNLGYDLTVSRSDNPTEIVINSKDFSNTDQRVRFLSFLRGRNSPATGVCLGGFQTVVLKSGWVSPLGFSEAYPLECSWR